MEKVCIFCDRNKIKDSILYSSDNFFCKVGVGILAKGHVMLVSKMHLGCFAELPIELREEFHTIKEKIANAVEHCFYDPIIYEHGIYSQSVRHAHIHFIPKKTASYDLSSIREKLFLSLKSQDIADEDVEKIFKKEGSYIYLEENGKRWVYHTKGLEDGKFTFRKEFARITRTKLIEWSKMEGMEKSKDKLCIENTKTILNKYFSSKT